GLSLPLIWWALLVFMAMGRHAGAPLSLGPLGGHGRAGRRLVSPAAARHAPHGTRRRRTGRFAHLRHFQATHPPGSAAGYTSSSSNSRTFLSSTRGGRS